MDTARAYGKAILAALGAVVVLAQTYASDGGIDASEKLLIVAAFAGAILVYGVTNPALPFWRYTKPVAEIVAGASAFLAAEWQNGATDLTSTHLIALGIIALTALGVVVAPGPTWPVNPPPVIESGVTGDPHL